MASMGSRSQGCSLRIYLGTIDENKHFALTTPQG